jgi:hypothetical protein
MCFIEALTSITPPFIVAGVSPFCHSFFAVFQLFMHTITITASGRLARRPFRRSIIMCANNRPDAKALMENLKKPMPVGKKAAYIIKNTFLKIINLKSCCGHQGEPGC